MPSPSSTPTSPPSPSATILVMRWFLPTLAMAQLLWAADSLPQDLAARFDLARQLPSPVSSAVMLNLIERHQVKGPIARDLASESYRLALESSSRPLLTYTGRDEIAEFLFSFSSGPLFHPDSTLLRAWAIHRDHSPDQNKLDIEKPTRPPTAPLTCEAFYAPDPGDYYETLLRLDPEAFAQHAQNTKSALDLVRILEAINTSQSPDLDLALALLNRITDNDRAFFFAVRRLKLSETIRAVMSKPGAPTEALLTAYRDFLLRHFAQKRCPDLLAESYVPFVGDFNRLAEAHPNLQIKPELATPKASATAEPETPFFDPASEQIRARISSAKLDEAESNAILTEIDSWRAPAKATAQHAIAIRFALYLELGISLPRAELRDRVARAWLTFLSRADVRREALPIWLIGFKTLAEDWVSEDKYRQAELEAAVDPALAALATLYRVDRQALWR